MRVGAVNAGRWDDVAQAMGSNGASVGCWRMFWRPTKLEIQAQTADENRAALCRKARTSPSSAREEEPQLFWVHANQAE
jgi:hypothetical protein